MNVCFWDVLAVLSRCNLRTSGSWLMVCCTGNLYTHARRHTGMMFHCTRCSFKTANRSHLTEHEQTHVSDLRVCDLCCRDYKTLKSLVNHTRKYHARSPAGASYLARLQVSVPLTSKLQVIFSVHLYHWVSAECLQLCRLSVSNHEKHLRAIILSLRSNLVDKGSWCFSWLWSVLWIHLTWKMANIVYS